MNWQPDPLLHLVGAGLIVVVLARAVVEKLSAYSVYVANLADYRLLPELLVRFAAPALLAAELAALCCLLVPAASPIGAAIAFALLGLYALAMSAALRAGRREIECGCGGDGQPVSWALVARNGVLMLISASIVLGTSARAMSWPDRLVGVVAILVLFLLLAIAEKMISTSAAIRRLDSGSHS